MGAPGRAAATVASGFFAAVPRITNRGSSALRSAITQYSDMKKLDEVIEEALRELKRRGKMIDVTPGAATPIESAGNGGLP